MARKNIYFDGVTEEMLERLKDNGVPYSEAIRSALALYNPVDHALAEIRQQLKRIIDLSEKNDVDAETVEWAETVLESMSGF